MKLTKRSFNKALATALPAALFSGMWSSQSAASSEPQLIGPLSGGRHDRPFGSPVEDVGRHGYMMEEYLLKGIAHRYQLKDGGSAPRTGDWDCEPGEKAEYVTRAFVVRPINAKDFNGVALVNWQNVTAGFDLGAPLNPEIFRGYAWIGVTTQKVAIDGNPVTNADVSETLETQPGLKDWDPERYGSLNHPGDAWSYDIFTQAGRLVKTGDQRLMGGLKPNIVIASGASQSAMRLGSYINAAHSSSKVFDGFYLIVHWGICPPIEEIPLMGLFAPTDNELSPAMCQIRDDLNVPILSLATECEARYNFPVRQAETSSFRFWEIAGASHGSPARNDIMAQIMKRDGVSLPAPPKDRNAIEWGYIDSAAIRAMVNWIREGKVPVSVPKISMTDDIESPIERDEFGNAIGGIRVPELEAPIASYRGERTGGLGNPNWLSGETKPFDELALNKLYPRENDRATRWNQAVDQLVKQGLVLPEDVQSLRSRGFSSDPFA